MTNTATVVHEIRTIEEFERVGLEWSELQDRCGKHSIFLGHPWLLACARNLQSTEKLRVLLLRQGERLLGAAPLLEKQTRIRRFPVRQIEFLGNPLTPFSDFLLESPAEDLPVILNYLLDKQKEWDVFSMSKLRRNCATLRLVEQHLKSSGDVFTTGLTSRTPCLEIRGNWEEFWRSKSQKFRKTRRSVANRVERLGSASVEVVHSAREAPRAIEEFLKLSQRSWTRDQGVDLLSGDFEHRFLSELAQVAASHGWLRLWLLHIEGKIVAGEFHLVDGDVEYGLRAHYDAAYASSSPGAYLDTYVVEQLFREGCTRYDMGPGVVGYKIAWTKDVYECHTVCLFHRRFYPRTLGHIEGRWIPAIRSSRLGQWLGRPRTGASEGHDSEADTPPANDF